MKASDWISVEDRLPQIDKRVMVCQSFNDGSTFARMATRVKINQVDNVLKQRLNINFMKL